MMTAGELVREWKRRMRAGEFDTMSELVDLDGYTEICLGLTGWTVGFDVALAKFIKNMVEPWSEIRQEEVDIVEGPNAVVTRLRVEAVHTGVFLGIAPTGRRVGWDTVSIVQVRGGQIAGQWTQPDLYGIQQQLLGAAPARDHHA